MSWGLEPNYADLEGRFVILVEINGFVLIVIRLPLDFMVQKGAIDIYEEPVLAAISHELLGKGLYFSESWSTRRIVPRLSMLFIQSRRAARCLREYLSQDEIVDGSGLGPRQNELADAT